jgi:hypothetical protein
VENVARLSNANYPHGVPILRLSLLGISYQSPGNSLAKPSQLARSHWRLRLA